MDIGHLTIGETKTHKDHIFNPTLNIALSVGGDHDRFFPKEVKNLSYDTYGEYLSLRFGDITIPSIKMVEPLRAEAEHFIECIASRKEPKTGGRDGVKVVHILTAAQQSLKGKGVPVSLLEG